MQWLDRFVEVMDIVSNASRDGVSMTEIMQQTGLPKATLHRMLTDMMDKSLVVQIWTTKRYRIGPKPMVWGGNYVEGQDPANLLAQFCDLLAERTGLYAFLSRYDSREVYCLYTRRPKSRLAKYFVHIGQKMPLHCTAAAKAILAFRPADEVSRLLTQRQLQRFTENTKTDIQEILAELKQVKDSHVAFCRNELDTGVTVLSTPVIMSENDVLFSISLIGETADIEKRESLIQELLSIGDEAGKVMKISSPLS